MGSDYRPLILTGECKGSGESTAYISLGGKGPACNLSLSMTLITFSEPKARNSLLYLNIQRKYVVCIEKPTLTFTDLLHYLYMEKLEKYFMFVKFIVLGLWVIDENKDFLDCVLQQTCIM